jgi:PmbA protein
MKETTLAEIAARAVRIARKGGAGDAAATVSRVREVEVEWRDGALEKVQESTTRGLDLELFVDGRWSQVSSSDLRPDALDRFVADAISMTRALTPDPHRALPDPSLYQNRANVDLRIDDPAQAQVSATERRRIAKELEEAARAVPGSGAILSVSTGVNDTLAESVRIASNGFEGTKRGTQFWLGASVSVKDPDGRRPEDSAWAGARFRADVPSVREQGSRATMRALGRIGSKKGESGTFAMVVDNRAAGRLVSALLGPLSGAALQQKRSFLEGKIGQQIGNARFRLADSPLLPKGLGSRLWDGEGITAKPRQIFEAGVLESAFIDTYYGRKLGVPPTSGSASNLLLLPGEKAQAELFADVKDGILVTGFLGGNSNATTGDFSHGVQGFRIRGGALAEPIGEMNVSGNHLELWKKLAAVGNDPWPYSTLRIPTLVFDGIVFAGA